jgi:hypothetical protein
MPIAGAFCAACGQRAVPAYPTLRELSHEAIGELFGWDGKIVRTFRTLFLEPGRLTIEFLEGHRARYLSPIRTYLIASVAYFLVAASIPVEIVQSTSETRVGSLRVGLDTAGPEPAPARARELQLGLKTPPPRMTKTQLDSALASIDSMPAYMRGFMRPLFEHPAEFNRALLSALPRAMFVLVPVFALIVGVFYRKRHFVDHLYFAIHFHAYVFGMFLVAKVAMLPPYLALQLIVTCAAAVAVVVYATKALRRIYSGSIPRTLLKELGIAALYLLAWIPVYVAALAWAVMTI